MSDNSQQVQTNTTTSRMGRPKMPVDQATIDIIREYYDVGLSLRNIKKVLENKYNTFLTLYKVQAIVKSFSN